MTQYLESDATEQLITTNLHFDRYQVLNTLAADLTKLVAKSKCHKTSFLVGRAIMIECSDLTECGQKLPAIAEVAGMKYITPTAQEIMEWICDDKPLLPEESFVSPVLAYLPIEYFIKEDKRSSKNEFGWDVPSWLVFSKALYKANELASLVVVVVGERFMEISEDLRAAHAFDRRFIIPKARPIERAHELMGELGPEHLDDSISQFSEKVGTLLNACFPDRRRLGMLVMALKRIFAREDRLIGYKDLLFLSVHGTGERAVLLQTNQRNLHRTAVHEAGHALIAMVDSDGANTPDYVSVLPGEGFFGVTVESYQYKYQELGCDSYQNARHSVRVALGGRAAEELILGVEQIGTSGLRADLEEISVNVRGFFAVHGVCLEMEDAEHTGSNLAAVVNGESPSESVHIESLMRRYIERQYLATLEIMQTNRGLMELIIEMLINKNVVYQDDLLPLLKTVSYQVPHEQ